MITTDSLKNVTAAPESPARMLIGGDLQFWRLTAAVLLIAIGVSFILLVIKLLLNYRLKSKMVEQDIPEDRIRLILGSGLQPLKEAALKWSLTAAGVALGLLIAGAADMGLAFSLTVVAACISASFGFYYLITKK